MTPFLIISAFLYVIYRVVLFFEDRRQIKAWRRSDDRHGGW